MIHHWYPLSLTLVILQLLKKASGFFGKTRAWEKFNYVRKWTSENENLNEILNIYKHVTMLIQRYALCSYINFHILWKKGPHTLINPHFAWISNIVFCSLIFLFLQLLSNVNVYSCRTNAVADKKSQRWKEERTHLQLCGAKLASVEVALTFA